MTEARLLYWGQSAVREIWIFCETCVISEQWQRCDISNPRTTVAHCRHMQREAFQRCQTTAARPQRWRNTFIAQRSSPSLQGSPGDVTALPLRAVFVNNEVPGLMTDTTAKTQPSRRLQIINCVSFQSCKLNLCARLEHNRHLLGNCRKISVIRM